MKKTLPLMKKSALFLALFAALAVSCGKTKTQSNFSVSTAAPTKSTAVTPPVKPAAVNKTQAASAPSVTSAKPAANVPAIEIKEKMFIAQTNDVYLNPEEYLGKTIRLEGLFKQETGYTSDYCFVVRYGPGCCGSDGNAGFEVAWNKAETTDKAYPKTDEWVEATGVLKTYTEEDNPYLYLELVNLVVKEQRGSEFVTQ